MKGLILKGRTVMRDYHKIWYKAWVTLSGVFLICGTAFSANVVDKPKAHIDVGNEGKSIQEEMLPNEEYTYIPGERRDPFQSLVQRGEEPGGVDDELSPLQRVDVNVLKVVGIVKNPEGNMALVQTPDGRGYFLRSGLSVGKNKGVVEKILEDKVVVQEKKADFLGQIQVSEVVLELNKKEEGNR
jgi:Tfp pilus assembly protein PilP